MTRVSQLQGPHTYNIATPAVTATADSTTTLWVAPFDCKVTEVNFVPQANVTADGTNNSTFSLKVGSTVLASRSWSATNSTAHTKESFTVSATPNVSKGDVVTIVQSHGGTGLALPAGILSLNVQVR